MKPFEPYTIREWGGLNEDENPSALRSNELVEVLNAAPYGRSLGTRPGVNREGAGADYDDKIAPITDPTVKGIYHFSKRNDFQRDIILAVSGQKLWHEHDNPGITADPGTANINADAENPITFAQYRGHVYLAQYKVGTGAQVLHYWDGATASFFGVGMTSVPNDGDAKYIIAKWGHLFAAGFDPQTTPSNAANPMLVRFNDIGSDATQAISWNPANTIGTGVVVGSIGGLKEYGGEFITGLAEYQDNIGDWLLLLTSHRIISVLRDGSTGNLVVDSAIANGCVHQNAYVNLGLDYGDAIYVSERGIHSLRQSQQFGGREDTFLSWKIRRIFDSLNVNRMPFICGGYDQTEGYVLFSVSTGSNTDHDTILCLDVKNMRGNEKSNTEEPTSFTAENAKWYVWKLSSSEKIASMAPGRDPDGNLRLYVGGTDGSVGYFSRDEYTDFGTGYSVSWTNKHEDFGAAMVEKAIGDMTVDVQPGGDYTPTVTTIFDFASVETGTHQLSMPAEGANWEEPSGQTPANVWADGAVGVPDDSTYGFDWASSDIITARNKLYGEGRGNTIATRYQHTGTDEPFWIAGQTIEVSGAGETIGAQGEGS